MTGKASLLVLTMMACLVGHTLPQDQQLPDKGLLNHWVFEPRHVVDRTVKDMAGRNDANIVGPLSWNKYRPALILDGQRSVVRVSDHLRSLSLPEKEITAEAWVVICTPLEWGGIVGAIQDNGSFEKGWLLGFRDTKFSFALSSDGSDDGDGRLTYLTAPSDFEPGAVAHVVGTYDGSEMQLYVNGNLVASSRDQSGRICYPDKAFYEMGAYHDENEFSPLHGDLMEVRVYARALTEEEVRAHFQAGKSFLPKPLPFKTSPLVRHIVTGDVSIAWETEKAGKGLLMYGESPDLNQRVEDPAEKTTHCVRLRGLKADADYYFRVMSRDAEGSEWASELFTFDSSSGLGPDPSPGANVPYLDDELTEMYARAAREIVSLTGVNKGYCLDLGCGDGRLSHHIAALTHLQVIGVEEDVKQVLTARRALTAAGVYGVRVTIHEGPLSHLPYTSSFANLIVSGKSLVSGELPGDGREVLRMLRPSGGLACLAQPRGVPSGERRLTPDAIRRWLRDPAGEEFDVREENGFWIIARRRLPGSGEWTHAYANPGNTACSGDRLRAPMKIQWFGQPGPRNMIDRHHRAVGPLSSDGRLFVPGNNRVIAMDAYNGVLLWDVEVPNSRRVGAARDCGHLALTGDRLYIAAGDKCLGLEVQTGEASLAFEVPPTESRGQPWWGYVACVGDLLFGSVEKKGASRTGHSRQTIVEGTYFDNRPVVTSGSLFCLDRHTGKPLWTYERKGGGAIVNSTLAIGEDHIYFIESDSPRALAHNDGRVPLQVLLESGHAFLVKLAARSGEKLWQRPAKLSTIRHVLFLCYVRSTLVLVGSSNERDHPRYDLLAFDASSGGPLWSNHYVRTDKPINGDHGEQDQHPAIVGDTVYSRPYAYDLRTGERRPFTLDRGGHGCGALSASAYYLYGRGGNPRMYPLSEGGRSNIALTRVSRPGCWINIVPAGGLLLIPESSSGCTCGYPLQTSIGLVPQE